MTKLTDSLTEISFRSAALTAASGLMLMIIAAMFAENLRTGLIVENNSVQTMNNIINHSIRFRISIICYVLVIILDVLVAWALYIYFVPINKSISLLAAFLRLIYAVLFFVALFNLIDIIIHFSDNQRPPSDLMFLLESFKFQWNFSFVFFGLHLVLLGWLAIRTKQMHNIFGFSLILAGLGYSIDGLGYTLIKNYSLSLIMFTFIGEVLLMLWLFIKGWKERPVTVNQES